MLTVFILLTGEWADALEPAAAILGPGCAAFFIFVVLLGKYLLMNLLVAVIVTEFGEDDPSATPTPRGDTTAREAEGTIARVEEEVEVPPPPWPEDYSLCLFNRVHPVRRACQWVLQRPVFNHIIITAIVVSSITLAPVSYTHLTLPTKA